MDWSENYELKYQEEVQSMHFGGSRHQAALHKYFDRSLYYISMRNPDVKRFFFCSISANVRYNAATMAHLKHVLDYIYQMNPYVVSILTLAESFNRNNR